MADALKRSSARPRHRRDSVLRLCAAGPPAAQRAGGDHREGGGQHAAGGGRRPGADDGPARGPDPGLFRYPGRQYLRVADPAGATCTSRTTTNLLVVSPDVGGVVRARAFAKRLDADLAIIDKRRPRANVAEVMNIIGDVEGRTCVIMDDMVDTANTLCKAAQALKERGAMRVLAYCTHPVLSGGAVAAHRHVGARRARGDRHDPAEPRCAEELADPPDLVRAAARRDDRADQQGRLGQLAVRRVVSVTVCLRDRVPPRSVVARQRFTVPSGRGRAIQTFGEVP